MIMKVEKVRKEYSYRIINKKHLLNNGMLLVQSKS